MELPIFLTSAFRAIVIRAGIDLTEKNGMQETRPDPKGAPPVCKLIANALTFALEWLLRFKQFRSVTVPKLLSF
jgi:hypothetical protein